MESVFYKGKLQSIFQCFTGTEFRSFSGIITRPTRLPDLVNSVDYLKMYMEADKTGRISGGTAGSQNFTQTDLEKAQAYLNNPTPANSVYPDPTNPRKYRYVGNTDWMKERYPGWASQAQHNVSILRDRKSVV